jgi:hypothetical protein
MHEAFLSGSRRKARLDRVEDPDGDLSSPADLLQDYEDELIRVLATRGLLSDLEPEGTAAEGENSESPPEDQDVESQRPLEAVAFWLHRQVEVRWTHFGAAVLVGGLLGLGVQMLVLSGGEPEVSSRRIPGKPVYAPSGSEGNGGTSVSLVPSTDVGLPLPSAAQSFPSTSTPGTSTPGTSTPGTSTPGTSTPGTPTPGTPTTVPTSTTRTSTTRSAAAAASRRATTPTTPPPTRRIVPAAPPTRTSSDRDDGTPGPVIYLNKHGILASVADCYLGVTARNSSGQVVARRNLEFPSCHGSVLLPRGATRVEATAESLLSPPTRFTFGVQNGWAYCLLVEGDGDVVHTNDSPLGGSCNGD